MVQGFIQPYVTPWPSSPTYVTRPYFTPWPYSPPATAIVEPGNPIGGAFTLPTGFLDVTSTFSFTPKTAWPGYTTVVYVDYYNGPGKFGPNHGATGPTRIVFPTANGNLYPTYNGTLMKWTGVNYGYGNPVTPTTTFDGRYDMSRGGSITVTPGPRRFGGTFRLFHGPNARWEQFVYYFSPILYEASGHYLCLDEGKFGCTPSTFASDIGDTTAQYQATWYLLTGPFGTVKVITPTTPNGKAPTPNGNASFITGMRRYLNLIHPWTTGFAKVHNAKGSPNVITPQAQGYDISLGGADITVTHYSWEKIHSRGTGYSSTFYTTVTTKQYLKGVTRVVSLVRPRLVHTYRVPLDPSVDPIANIRQLARLWSLKVFFLPEPGGMLMLGAGIAALLGLSRMRRR
jgi:hypothetical protein